MAEEYTRSEFLKSLLNQKKAIINSDSSLLNPSINNNDESQAIVNSSNPNIEISEEEQYKNERNGWQRFWDSISNFTHNINEGIQKYVLDPIGDAGIWLAGGVGGIFGADTDWVKEAQNYDWGAHYLGFMDQLDFGSNLMSGDLLGFDGGDYWKNWADFTSVEESRQNFANLAKGSLLSNNEELQAKFKTGEEILGSLLPSIALAVGTAGASAGVQAGVFAGQVAAAGVAGFGRATNEALNEGAEFGKSGLYGLTRGSVDAALTYAGGKVVGQLMKGGVGLKVGNAVFGKTGNMLIATATKIGVNAGISGIEKFADEALIKPAEKLIYNQNAWKEAYGSESATYETLTKAGQAGLTAVAMSALSQSLVEGSKYVVQGKETYKSDFVKQYDYSKNKKEINAKLKDIESVAQEMQDVSSELNVYEARLSAKDITEEAYMEGVKPLLAKFEEIQTKGNELATSLQNITNTSAVQTKYGQDILSNRTKLIENITNSYNVGAQAEKALIHKHLTNLFDDGWKYDEVLDAVSNPNGTESIKPDVNGNPMITFNDNGNEISLPIKVSYKNKIKAIPDTPKQAVDSIIYLGNDKLETQYAVALRTNDLVAKNVATPNKLNELTISKEVAKEIATATNLDQLKEFFEIVKENKGKQVVKDNNRYLIINTYKDKDGVLQTAITTIDSKFENVESLKIQPAESIVPMEYATSPTAAQQISNVIRTPITLNSDNKLVKAYGDLNHERVLSLKKSQDIIDIAKEQILDKIVKKEGRNYEVKMAKGELSKELFNAINTLDDKYDDYGVQTKSDLSDAINEIATQISESKVITTTANGIKIESQAGHKEDLIKAINVLVSAKSELSKVAKIEKRFDLTIANKNEQILNIRNRANENIARAGEIFSMIRKELKQEISNLKKTKDLSVQITKDRERFKAKITGDYNYNDIEERDLHTMNMLAKPIGDLTRNKGRYKITPEGFESWRKAQDVYKRENYELTGSIEFDDDVKLALDNVVSSLSNDINMSEISLESYQAIESYLNAVKKYERRLADTETQVRKPSAYTASYELDNYKMNAFQKATDVITYNFGGKAGEIFKRFGYGEITKKTVIALDQASGEKINFIVDLMFKLAECMPNGFHSKKNAGQINGVNISNGQLVYLYMATELAPVNAENINIGGIGIRGKQKIEWAFKGEGHLDEIKKQVNELIKPEEKEIGKKLFELLNGDLQDSFIKWSKEVKHEIDVPKVEKYLMMYKETEYDTSIDKMVRGEPAFRYAEQRTNDKRGLIIPDVVEVFKNYIDGLGTQMYMTPAVHEAYALLNSKDQTGITIGNKIKQKYGDKVYNYLTDLIDAWIKKSNTQTANVVTKVMNFLTEGYTVSKLADLVRPVKNYFSFITANGDLGKQTSAYISRTSKETRDDVNWLIENHIYNLKHREYDNALLKGNAPTTYEGIKGKIDKVLMHPVTKVDKAAMVMGLTAIVNDVKKSGQDVRNPEVIKYIKDAYSIFNLCNVNGDPNHQNLLNENSLTKFIFNILAGAKRAQVASGAIQMSFWEQNHNITPEVKLEMDKELAHATELVKEKTQVVKELESEYEKSLELLARKRDLRDWAEESNQDLVLINEAKQEVADELQNSKDIKEKIANAREEEAEARAKEKTEQNKQESYKHYEYAGGKKIPFEIFAKTLIAGILTTGVSLITNWLYGKKDLNEYTKEDIIASIASNSFLNWIPVVDTVSGVVLKGYTIDPPAVSTLNNMLETISSAVSSVKNGEVSKGMMTGLITMLEGITGLPLDTARKYIYGILKTFDPESALKFNSVFYNTTSTYATRMYNENVESGNDKMAKAYLSYMSNTYKGGVSDDRINNELLDLSKQGFNAIPKNVMSEYTDSEGNTVKLSAEQIKQFTELYAESTSKVNSLISSESYRTSTAEEKSKLIKSLYDYYYAYAKAKVLGTAGDSKISKVLVLTNGNVDMANYIVYLQKIGTITENKRKTRKELVLDYINRLRISRNEKILLMYLSGYSVSGNSENALISFLMKNGATRKEAQALLKGE